MSFEKLYAAVQSHKSDDGRISTKWLRDLAIDLSGIKRVKEQWSDVIDANFLRGFYIEGPMGPPIPLAESECLIGLSRSICTGAQGKNWRRFIYTKELMHVFDTEEEKAGTREAFDIQVEKFGNPSADVSPQFRAEYKAIWRALAVLCPEAKRLEYKKALQSGEKSVEVVAAALRLPAPYIHPLVRDDFEAIIKSVM